MTGNDLKLARKKAGVSQMELASIWGITRNTLYRWEKSARLPRKVEMLSRLWMQKKFAGANVHMEGCNHETD